MKTLSTILMMSISFAAFSAPQVQAITQDQEADSRNNFRYLTEQFADAKILRYQVPEFEKLSLKQKELIYYLSQAALCGRDIIYDQNFKSNLLIRNTLEVIYENYKGDRNNENFTKFVTYLKRVWFSNGIHHHYSTDKFLPEFPQKYFAQLVTETPSEAFPRSNGQSVDDFIEEMSVLMYSPDVAAKKVSLDPSRDMVVNSATNFYEGVTQKEVEEYYSKAKAIAKKNKKDTLISFGLNSKLMKEKGVITEKTYKVGGLYSRSLEQIVKWLEKALVVAETDEQRLAIRKLIEYYRTGNLETWDQYNIAWVKDLKSSVDFVNGFVEVYGDPIAMKGSWESIVNFKNVEATKRTEILSRNAQYFEDISPVAHEFKKEKVVGVSAKVITVAQLGGDSDPTTAIGINLPNANWIRKTYGSKSVTMDNITDAYDKAAQGNGFIEEFAASEQEIERSKQYGQLAGSLTTDLHECLGHGSGQLNKGVTAEALKNYHSTIEEARADLFALYFIIDPVLEKFGLVPNDDVAKTEYDNYIRNGLMTQLVRIHPGKTIEESHMRDRALISKWVFEHGKDKKVIEQVTRDGKTYFSITDYNELRTLFGQLLRIVQRITSEGDYTAARDLVEGYGVKVDAELHKEVLDRYQKLNIAPYTGFINPVYTLVEKDGAVTDVTIAYPEDFATQMMSYSKNYSFLPIR